ncbi:hypothetical protein QQ045_020724 [Rhodiola kirilowii]
MEDGRWKMEDGLLGRLEDGLRNAAELENLMVIVANPRQFNIPDWFLNRKKDYKDGRYSQFVEARKKFKDIRSASFSS